VRKALLVLTLLVGVFVTLGAAPAVSSANSNCTISYGAIAYDNGYLHQGAAAFNCQDVDQVEWTSAVNGAIENLYDVTTGFNHLVSAPPTIGVITCGRLNIAYHDVCSNTIYVHPWCPPQTTHVVKGEFLFHIHNIVQHSWGNWYFALAPGQGIWC
jgi:hypothetical protein